MNYETVKAISVPMKKKVKIQVFKFYLATRVIQ